jgi:hypothetical protein
MNDKKIIEVLEMIAKDQADDAKNFEGAPFTGRTVAEYFGNQGAAIAALANIIKSLIESRPTKDAPDLGESSASDGESKPAPKRVI